MVASISMRRVQDMSSLVMLWELVERPIHSTTGTQCLGQRSRKQYIILRLARCFGAFFNKLLGLTIRGLSSIESIAGSRARGTLE
jgi:hypothetical protein